MEDNIKDVPFCVYESMASRSERTIKRLIVALIISVLLLFATNVVWLVTDVEYGETQTIEADQDGHGTNIIGGGDISYGAEGENHNG